MTSLPLISHVGDANATGEEIFDTAPNSPEKSSAAPSPEKYFSLSISPAVTPILIPDTPKSKKTVSWSLLPPKMDRTDLNPTRSSITPWLRTSEPLSPLIRPRAPTLPQSPSLLPHQLSKDAIRSLPQLSSADVHIRDAATAL